MLEGGKMICLGGGMERKAGRMDGWMDGENRWGRSEPQREPQPDQRSMWHSACGTLPRPDPKPDNTNRSTT